MAELKFRVQADYEKVQRLRDEITKLKQEIKGVDAIQDPTSFNKLNSKLQQTSKELGTVTGKIAQASAAMETDFKQKIFAASQSVNGFTEKIIAQKAIVRDVAADVRRLGEAYHDAAKTSPMSASGKLEEWKAARRALEEEKAALFGLTQEQANARLSVKKLRDEYALLREEGGGTAETMNLLTGKLKQMSGMLLGGMGLKELASRIISVRAEFESMETSLKVLLGGNQERLNSIMAQIKEYALASPLNTKDMVGAVQMMTSFGIEAEKSIDYLKAIGDISMGDTGKFNGLALAFSQMSSAGKLMGQDLMQMVNAGFNPLEEISRKTGKSIGELKEEMSKGAISSKMVQDAFISATSAGGKFYGMSQEGAKTLNGQISMLQESFDNMFNEIGSKGEGVVMTAVQMATKLVENYEQVGKVLAGLVITYGTYKTALILSTQMTNGMTMAQVLHTTATKALTVAEAALNKTILANPYVLAAVALGTLITAVVLAGDSMTAAERAQDNYNKKIEENSKLVKDEKYEIDRLIGTLEDETSSIESKNIAFSTLIAKYPTIFGKYKTEKDLIDHITEARQRENAEIERKTTLLGQKTYADSKTRATELNRLKYLQENGDIKGRQTQSGYKKGKNQDEYLRLWNKYHDDIKKTQTWYGTESAAIDRLSSVANEEYKLNINENRKSQIAKYNANVVNLSKTQAQKELARLRSNLNKMDKSGKNYLKIGNNEPLNREQIKERITLLENNVKTERKTMAQWRKDAEKETKKNRKAAKELASSTELLTKDQAEKKMKAANDTLANLEKAEKNFEVQDKSGAKAKSKAERERKQKIKDANAHQKAVNDLDSKKIAKSQALLELENQVEQARIDALHEGSEKTIAAMKLAHKKELEQIDKQKQEYLKKKQDEAEAEFKANPKNKDKTFNRSVVTLSKEEQDRFDTIKKDTAKKHINEELAIEDELIKNNQSYYDKKTDLVKKYSKDVSDIYKAISEAEKRGDKDKVDALYRTLTEARANYGKEQMTLAFEQLKKDPNYVAAFDDLKGASTDTLSSLIGRFSEVKQAAGEALNPEGVKTYFDAINGMIDELISRDPIGMMKKLTDELIKQQDELKAAENRRDRVKNGEKIVKSIGYNKDLKKWVFEYWELADAEADVAAKGQQVAQTTNKIASAHKTLTKTIQGVADKMGELGGKIGGQTGEIFSLFGSVMTYYQTISDGVTSIGKAGSNAMKAIESASVILAIISTAIQLMKTLSSVLPNQDDLYEKAAQKQAEINKLRDSVNDYRLAVMKARHEESNWFSDSGLKGLQDAYEEHGQVAESYYKKLNEAQEKYINKSSGLKKALVPIVAGVTAIAAVAAGVFTAGTGTAAIGALGASIIGTLTTTAVTATVATAAGAAVAGLAGAIVGKAIDSAVSSITYKNGQVAAKDNLRIQTRHKSFWRSQKTADLKEWVKDKYGKDLFGEDGMVDKELANEVLKNYGNKLQGETKETLEKLVELREKYDEFNKSIHEYVSKMYSPLVSDMTDAVWSWLKNGKDALSEFKNSASKTFAEISKDMVKQLLLKNVFSQYEDKLSDLYKAYAMKSINENELGAASAQLAGEIVDGMNSYLPVAQNLLKQLQEGFAAKGIDITKEGDSSQTATANGVTTITFEQASNIVALTTAGNISRDQIKDILTAKLSTMDASMRGVQMMAVEQTSIADEMRTIQANSYLELQGIHDDTSAMSKTLKMLSSDVSDIKKNIKDM